MHKSLVIGVVLLMLGCNGAPASVVIVRDGHPVASIHIPDDATLQERFAAQELQRYILKATGARLALEEGPAGFEEPAIVVSLTTKLARMGETAFHKELKLGPEGIVNRTSNNHLIIAGGGPRGVVYAAYNFLEYIGYRWYWPGEIGEVTPHLSNIWLERMHVAREPSFERRHAMGGGDSGDLQWNLAVKDWLTKNHQNFWVWPVAEKGYEDFMAKRGGTNTKVGSGHNWQHIIPPSKYFATHPEWFPEIGGKRVPYGQLCLSNPQVIDKLTEYAMEGAAKMAEDPSIMFIDLTQNDGHGWCQCEKCRAIDDRDPTTHADILLWAINQIADRVERKYPKAVLMVYIYAGAAGPPSWIKPRPNVLIEETNYCYNYGASFLNPNSGRGQLFKKQLDAWAQMATRHGIYEYYGFYNWLEALPITLYRLREEIPYYKKIGISGFYSETEQRWATNHLLYYAFSRLWWDHTTDVEAMMDEFFRLFYGPAEEPMRKFYMALETSGGPDRYWSGDEFNLPQIYPPDLRARCRAWLEQAKALAQYHPKILARLHFVELGWRYTELHLEAMEAQAACRKDPTAENKQRAKRAWQQYVAYFDELRGTHAFAESALDRFKARAQKQLAAYTLDLADLPAGEFEYSDRYNLGGNAALHGHVAGFYSGTWGLCLRPGASGSVTYVLGAQKGHRWEGFKFAFDGWRALGGSGSGCGTKARPRTT